MSINAFCSMCGQLQDMKIDRENYVEDGVLMGYIVTNYLQCTFPGCPAATLQKKTVIDTSVESIHRKPQEEPQPERIAALQKLLGMPEYIQ